MESTESVTGLQHATPGEVLVCQIDERILKSSARRQARGINAGGVGARGRNWRHFKSRKRSFHAEITIENSDRYDLRHLGKFISR